MKIKLNLNNPAYNPDYSANQINGIHSNAFFKGQYSSTFTERVKDSTLTIFRELVYSMKAAAKSTVLLFKSNNYKTIDPIGNRSGLVVFFHGLNGRPSVWNNHIEQYEQQNKKGAKVDLFAPTLPKLGHCSVDDKDAQVIYGQVKAWIEKNPGKPVVVYGQSNGSRFAANLEQLLRKECPGSPVYVSLTGAVLYGTSLVTKINKIIGSQIIEKITFGLLSKKACEELSLGSESSKELLSKVRNAFESGVAERRYRMYASLHDSHILEYGSSLPRLSESNEIDEKHYFVTGYGHNSLVDSVLDEQIAKTFHWMQRKLQENFSKEICPHCLEKLSVVLQKGVDDSVEIVDQRKIIFKIIDFAESIFNQIAMMFKKLQRKLLAGKFPTPVLHEGKVSYPTDTLPWKNKDSNGLYLFVHGLRGSPADWESYTKKIEQSESRATIFAPNVYAKGNISLEKAAEPILEAVRDYLREHPGKPIHIFGTSNGSRIATFIENHLAKEELGNSPLRIVSVAGVLNGTKFVDFLERYHLAVLAGLDPELQQEFKWESDVAKTTLNGWREKQKIWHENNKDVRHFYCASLEDKQVWPITSSLPNSEHTINSHRVFTGQTHMSIVEKACSPIFDWLEKNKELVPVRSISVPENRAVNKLVLKIIKDYFKNKESFGFVPKR